MTVQISNVYVQSYEQTVRHLAQQGETKLRDWVTERGVSAEKHNWETLDQVNASEKTSPRTATPTNDSPWNRRVSLAKTYHVGDTTEQEDPVQMLVDPNSNVARAQGMAMKRQVDDVVIAAATGTALDGGGNNVAFPASQEVGDYTGQISFDVVTEVNEKFMANDIDPDDPKVCVVGPKQVRKLLQLTEVTSADYVAVKALAGNGMVPNWMGMTWINSTRLLLPASNTIDCFAMTRRAIGLQMNRDITARIAEDPSLSFAWRIYCYLTCGAVRVEDKDIVRIKLLNTV